MQMQMPVMTLQNLMQFNDALFDNIVLPAGADRDLMKYAILFNYNEMQVVYPDWAVFRFTTENWFASHLSQLQHLFNDWEATYNPVYNKDGYYEEERTPDIQRSREENTYKHSEENRKRETETGGTVDVTENPGSVITESGSTTEQYKGFNSSTFNDVSKELPGKVSTASGVNTGKTESAETGKDTTNGTVTDTGSGSTTEREYGSEKITRHEYGNIGVTMASQMLRDDKSFWERFAFYDVAAKLYAVDNLVMIY